MFQKSVIPHVRSFSPGLRQSLIRWGQWFDRNTPANAVIATPDIGAIGYFSRRSVVDLTGLVTPAMVPLLARETPEEAVATFGFAAFSRPDYLVDRGPEPYALRRASRYGSALVPLGYTPMPQLGMPPPADLQPTRTIASTGPSSIRCEPNPRADPVALTGRHRRVVTLHARALELFRS